MTIEMLAWMLIGLRGRVGCVWRVHGDAHRDAHEKVEGCLKICL